MGRLCHGSLNFKGRVGDVIGTHWRDIHVIKTFPTYHYMRTSGQAVCRNNFQKAVALSHIGQAAMYPAPMFATGYRSSWNGRVSLAMYNVQHNIDGAGAIPIVMPLTPVTWGNVALKSHTIESDRVIKLDFTCDSDNANSMFLPEKYYSFTLLPNSRIMYPWYASVFYGRVDGDVASSTLYIQDLDGFFSLDAQCVLCSAKQDTTADVPQYSGVFTI